MSPLHVPPPTGTPPALRLVHGGRHSSGSPRSRGDHPIELRVIACARRPRSSPFQHYLQAPRRSATPRWVLAGAFACWLGLGWTLLVGVVEPIGRGVVHEGTRSLFVALARGGPLR